MSARRNAWIAVGSIVIITITAFLSQMDRGPRNRSGEAVQGQFGWHSAEIMSTLIEVLAPAGRDEEAAEIVFQVFRDVDTRMSEWKESSPLSALNQAAGKGPVAIPEDLRALLRRGLEIGRLTHGAFAVTWAALWGLWDFKSPQPHRPDDGAIAARLALVDDSGLTIDDASGTATLARPGMMVGLGGIAKGHALDRAAAALRQRGIDDFLISAGGQVYAGGRRGERPWQVGIRDPRGPADDFFASLEASNISISTSGDYERYFIIDDVRYHHILDPRTGRPTRGLRSATIVTADATMADALSTACMVLGKKKALALVESMDGVEAVLVDKDASVSATRGLAEHLHMTHEPRP